MSSYKTNWQLTETVMPEDMNRIEQNVKDNNKNHTDFKTEYDKTLKEQNKKIDGKSEKSDVVFKVPKRLSATTDLNTICTGGNYVVLPNTPNSPNSGKYGRLVVYQWDNSGKWITQVFYTDGVNEVYTRCSLNDPATSWTPWQKLLNINEGDSRYFRTYIDGISTDFNNAKTQGIYHVSGDFENSPQEGHVYGVLEVIARDKHRTQRFTDINNNVWNRFYNSGSNSWTSWSKIYSESNKPTWNDVQNKPSSFPPSNHNHDDRYVNKDLGIATDFNLCTKTGIYKVANPQPFKNGPSGASTYGELEVYEYTSGVECLQRYTDANGNIYTRFKNSSTWRNWQKFYSENNKPTWDEIKGRPSVYPPATHNHDSMYQPKESTTFTTQESYVAVRTPARKSNQYYEFWDKDLGWANIKAGELYANNNRVYHPGNKPTWSDITEKPSAFVPSPHTHDDRYGRHNMGVCNDFNNAKCPWGIYKINGIVPNNPVGEDTYGVLEVIQRDNHFHQKYTDILGRVWIRRFNGTSNSWEDWFTQFSEAQPPSWNDISSKPNSFPPSNHDHDSKYLQYNRGNIGSSSDFNNATAVGVYGVGYDNTIPNAPVSGGVYGVLEVLSKPNELIQRVTSSSGDIWVRLRNWQGIWRSWSKLTTVNDFGLYRSEQGYQRLPSGLLIQWGRVNATLNNTWSVEGYINLPIAFKNIYNVNTVVADGTTEHPVYGKSMVKRNTTGSCSQLWYTVMDIRMQNKNCTYAFDWIAIGI